MYIHIYIYQTISYGYTSIPYYIFYLYIIHTLYIYNVYTYVYLSYDILWLYVDTILYFSFFPSPVDPKIHDAPGALRREIRSSYIDSHHHVPHNEVFTK